MDLAIVKVELGWPLDPESGLALGGEEKEIVRGYRIA
jgi:hypothetical protein